MFNNRQPRKGAPRASRAQKKVQASKDSPATLASHVLGSLGVSVLTALASLLILSVAAYFSEDPAALLPALGLCASALTALVGGFAAVRLHKKSALLCGLCNGCAMMALMLVASLFFGSEASSYSPLVSCLLHAAFLFLSVLGAFLALPRAGAVAKRHPTHRR